MTNDEPDSCPRDFPTIGERMQAAYLDLWLAPASREHCQTQPPGAVDRLPRPWDVATCRDSQLRREVWQWLDKVVDWINTEYVWTPDDMVPDC